MKHNSLGFWNPAVFAVPAAILFASLAACGGDDGGGDTTPDAGGSANTGTYYHYATSQLKVGTSANEANSFAFDLDGVAGKDNSLGGVLAGLNSQLMIDMAIQAALTDGDFVILHSLRADDLTTDSTASWQIFLGDPQAAPKYDGTGTFTVASNSPTTAKLSGAIAAGKYLGGPGSVTLSLSLIPGEAPLQIQINAARIEANVSATGCTSGRIGGAIKADTLSTQVVPLLASQLDARIAADAGCREDINMCEASNKLILDFFDTSPKDRMITRTELEANPLVMAILMADVDVLNAAGQAGTDGTKESVSIALGFTCVKGTYTAPGE
jgi:hypothetical protein